MTDHKIDLVPTNPRNRKPTSRNQFDTPEAMEFLAALDCLIVELRKLNAALSNIVRLNND